MSGVAFSPIKKIFASLVCLSSILSACAVIGAAPAQETPTPIPTSRVPGLQVVSSPACQVAERTMIRVEHPQGDLISWSPVTDTLAYIATSTGSSWNVGDLNLLSAPGFDTTERVATQVAGELTWSPDGTVIAFLGLRLSDGLYTIGLAYPGGLPSKDLFPGEAARTDGYSSQKSIVGWMGDDRLRVFTSCGVDCMQGVDIATSSGDASPVGGATQRVWDQWAVHTNQPDQASSAVAELSGQLNWSPDESMIAYIDTDASVWIIDLESDILFVLDIGEYATATETDWSFDGQYLAVQVDQTLRIFSLQCP